MDIDTPVSTATRAAISEVFQSTMRRFGLVDVAIWPDSDHDGDPVIRVEAKYEDNGEPVDTHVVADLLYKVNDAAMSTGERRFVHPTNRFGPGRRMLKRELA